MHGLRRSAAFSGRCRRAPSASPASACCSSAAVLERIPAAPTFLRFGTVVLTIGVGFLVSPRVVSAVPAAWPGAALVRATPGRRPNHDAKPSSLRVSVHGQPEPIAPATDSSAVDDTLQMDEEAFRAFYTHTSGMVWAYLARATNDPAAADDCCRRPTTGYFARR